MRLINMTCPNCGSQLQIDADNKQAMFYISIGKKFDAHALYNETEKILKKYGMYEEELSVIDLLVVLGVCALIHPVPVESEINKRDFPISILAVIIVMIGSCFGKIINGRLTNVKMYDIVGNVSRWLSLRSNRKKNSGRNTRVAF